MNKLYIPGDLVMVKKSALQFAKDKIFKVISSLSGGFVKVVMLNDSSTTYSISNNAVRPIPLTSEIIEKNGWKLHKNHKRNSYDDVSWSSYHKPSETNISLRFYPEEDAFFLFLYAQEISETPIKYIHQFQHILFGLGLEHEMEV